MDSPFEAEIELVRTQLREGRPASEIATSLFARGFGSLVLLKIFQDATGASLRDLKTFGRWWDPLRGVTDPAAFDDWASQVFQKVKTTRE